MTEIENSAAGKSLNSDAERLFPELELLRNDDTVLEYQVTFQKGHFWLAVPREIRLNDLSFIILFPGRGGSGKVNNLTLQEIPRQFLQRMLREGFGFICAEFSPNAWGDQESTDVTLAAVEYCREQGLVLPEKMDLLGFSMGGLGALMFAARHPERVRKVTDVFGITDLESYFKQKKFPEDIEVIPAAELQDRSPCSKIRRYKNMEFLIVHGECDKTVDIAYSERFYTLLKEENIPSRFLVIPGCAHSNDILKDAGDAIRQFFASRS